MELTIGDLEPNGPIVDLVGQLALLGASHVHLRQFPAPLAAYDRSIALGLEIPDPNETALGLAYLGRARTGSDPRRPPRTHRDPGEIRFVPDGGR